MLDVPNTRIVLTDYVQLASAAAIVGPKEHISLCALDSVSSRRTLHVPLSSYLDQTYVI